MLTPISEFDIVFISYDEPNADENYANLLEKCPWAKRSHGVYGSDAAHKAAAKLAETDRFVTIDADNIVWDDFFNIELDMNKVDTFDVVSWAGKNVVNGLVYGNGGIKMWPKVVVEQMRTHEVASSPQAQVDFCWDIHYRQMNNVYSWVHNNASPYQAYRAGFREGVKMSLDGGVTVNPDRLKKIVHDKNYQRLLVWCSVGADITNGLWAMYGTRLGCYLTNMKREEFDFVNVRDFKWHDEYWKKEIMPQFVGTDELCPRTNYAWSREKVWNEIRRLGMILRNDLGLEITELDTTGSKFFKEVYVNPPRLKPMVREDWVMQGVDGH